MPKKRKTRKQKVLTEQKRHVVHETDLVDTSSSNMATKKTTTDITFSLPKIEGKSSTSKSIQQTAKPAAISTSEYGYLAKDLIKTTVITGAIVIAELLIRTFYLH